MLLIYLQDGAPSRARAQLPYYFSGWKNYGKNGRYDELVWLVVSTPLKNMKISWDYYSQYMEK